VTATVRAAVDTDADALVSLIGDAYAEYPGCVLDLPDLDADLLAPAAAAAARGGRWWVVQDAAGRIVASVGTGPRQPDGTLELKRLYVAASHRRQGLARSLVARVEAHAAGLASQTVELWSDTRFAAAHHLYERLGYLRSEHTRDLHDPSHTTEFHFSRPVRPRPARRTVRWVGPDGIDTCAITDLPDGKLLAGTVGDVRYRLEVDGDGLGRGVELEVAGRQQRVSTDGVGGWWLDGHPAPALTGCTDIALGMTPVADALAIRRGATDAALLVAHVEFRSDGSGLRLTAEPVDYRRIAGDRWERRSERSVAILTVDDEGLPVEHAAGWRRVDAEDG
jgi:GNAT superfamily N-acetyltransferase